MIPLWKGIANAWDCDEMGHMNVRVYAEKAQEGWGLFAAAINMGHAFRAKSPSTLIPSEQHIRFIKEALPGFPLSMHGCVLEWDETSVLLYQEMRHGDGTPAAAFRTRLTHAEAKSGKPFGWSSSSRKALDALIDTPPDQTAPRGIDITQKPLTNEAATLEAVSACDAPQIGMGMVPPQHCDVNGRMLPSWFIGRISDSVPNLLHDWRQSIVAKEKNLKIGAAVVEYRLIFRRWPRPGSRFVAHSSLGNVSEKTQTLIHWVLDPDTGAAWCTAEAVALTFDLTKRKTIPASKDHIQALEAFAPRGLQL
ncbi:MAG: thioesterase family protein [Henriciella sp.]